MHKSHWPLAPKHHHNISQPCPAGAPAGCLPASSPCGAGSSPSTPPLAAVWPNLQRVLQIPWAAPSAAVVIWWRRPLNALQAEPSSFAVACSTAEGRGQRTGCVCLMGGGDAGEVSRARLLQECHDTPLGGHFGRHKSAALVRWLAY